MREMVIERRKSRSWFFLFRFFYQEKKMKVKFFLSYDTHQSLSFSCHSELVSESHSICHFEVSRNLLSLFFVKKTNEKRLVFDFRRSKLVSAIQCFKSFATQTVKHFNHAPQLFDTRLQIIWHFFILFQYSNSLSFRF